MGSWSQSITTQQDLRTAIEGAELVAAPESILSMPGSIAVGDEGHYTYTGQFTPEVAAAIENILESHDKTITELLGLTGEAIAGLFSANKTLTEQAGQIEAQAQVETASFGKYIPYIAIGLIAFAILRK